MVAFWDEATIPEFLAERQIVLRAEFQCVLDRRHKAYATEPSRDRPLTECLWEEVEAGQERNVGGAADRARGDYATLQGNLMKHL